MSSHGATPAVLHVIDYRRGLRGAGTTSWACTCGESGSGDNVATVFRETAHHIEAAKLEAAGMPAGARVAGNTVRIA